MDAGRHRARGDRTAGRARGRRRDRNRLSPIVVRRSPTPRPESTGHRRRIDVGEAALLAYPARVVRRGASASRRRRRRSPRGRRTSATAPPSTAAQVGLDVVVEGQVEASVDPGDHRLDRIGCVGHFASQPSHLDAGHVQEDGRTRADPSSRSDGRRRACSARAVEDRATLSARTPSSRTAFEAAATMARRTCGSGARSSRRRVDRPGHAVASYVRRYSANGSRTAVGVRP